MSGLTSVLYDLYVRLLVWLGAEPPPGYEHLLPAEEAGPREYTLQEGETIFSVARKFGIHYDRIAQANGIEDLEAVQSGQTLIIPPPEWDPADGPLTQPQPEPEPEPIVEPEPQRSSITSRKSALAMSDSVPSATSKRAPSSIPSSDSLSFSTACGFSSASM